ncbi:Hypothetical protein ACI5QL_01659 [Bacillus velezensis]
MPETSKKRRNRRKIPNAMLIAEDTPIALRIFRLSGSHIPGKNKHSHNDSAIGYIGCPADCNRFF